MTNEEKRIAIAKACPFIDRDSIKRGNPLYWEGGNFVEFDPLNDLNAMHEAMETLTDDQLFKMSRWLQHSTRSTLIGVAVMHSTAAQRADAFIETLELGELFSIDQR